MAEINDTYDIIKAIKSIENELIASMIANLDHHRAEETKEKLTWSQWQVVQLQALEEYKKRNAKKYGTVFEDINKQIDVLISMQRQAGNSNQEEYILNAIKNGAKLRKPSRNIAVEGAFFKLNDRKINALINATVNDMKKGETAILRMTNDQYRKIIYNAQIYAASGATYKQAVDMATKDFLRAGINCIEYSNGSRHTLSEYADMAIRTAQKRAYLTGEGEIRKAWGIHTVIMNKRLAPCPKCLPFVGKILIDDVWSGGSSRDGPYPLMSKAIAAGLYHPRCQDVHTTYFEGISTPPDDSYTKQELEDIESKAKKEAEQQYAKRQAEKYERLSRYSLDDNNKRIYDARAKEWKEKAEYLIRNSTGNANIDKESKLFNEVMSIIPLKVREKIEQGTIIDIGKKGASQYDYINDIMYIAEAADKEEIIHEIGHMVENKLLDTAKINALKKDILSKISPKDIVTEIYFDAGGNPHDIFLIKNNQFLSDYQGRLYVDDWSEIYDEDWNIKPENLAEFMSESFREYIMNPEKLKKEFPKFYGIIEEALK